MFLYLRGIRMTTKEGELIERLMRENEEFLKAKQAHSQLANQLEELEKKPFLTPQDEMEIKIIKKKKLAFKDQMEKILMQYR
jgi:uncharacterized protein YdcH (DUF465 family)